VEGGVGGAAKSTDAGFTFFCAIASRFARSFAADLALAVSVERLEVGVTGLGVGGGGWDLGFGI
jgi:hypothetical protein